MTRGLLVFVTASIAIGSTARHEFPRWNFGILLLRALFYKILLCLLHVLAFVHCFSFPTSQVPALNSDRWMELWHFFSSSIKHYKFITEQILTSKSWRKLDAKSTTRPSRPLTASCVLTYTHKLCMYIEMNVDQRSLMSRIPVNWQPSMHRNGQSWTNSLLCRTRHSAGRINLRIWHHRKRGGWSASMHVSVSFQTQWPA